MRTRRPGLLVLVVVMVAAAVLLLGAPRGVPVAAAATCSDYATQAAAQAAADTRDSDG